MSIVRRIGGLLLMVAAVVVWFAAAPDEVDTAEHRADISTALENDSANNLLTEGAPQQSVVNGWTAKDLLVIQAEQNNDLLEAPTDPRPGLLLLLAVIGVGFIAITTESSRPAPPEVGPGFIPVPPQQAWSGTTSGPQPA